MSLSEHFINITFLVFLSFFFTLSLILSCPFLSFSSLPQPALHSSHTLQSLLSLTFLSSSSTTSATPQLSSSQLLIALSISLAEDRYQLCGCFSFLTRELIICSAEESFLVLWPLPSWLYCLLSFSCYQQSKHPLVLYFPSILFFSSCIILHQLELFNQFKIYVCRKRLHINLLAKNILDCLLLGHKHSKSTQIVSFWL